MKLLADLDEVSKWQDSLGFALRPVLPSNIDKLLKSSPLHYDDDAQDIIFDQGGRAAVVGATLSWIRDVNICGYHGTRVAADELASIKQHGLVPLDPDSRLVKLTRILSAHPKWGDCGHKLEDCISAMGPGQRFGEREGQVHLTLSAQGLTRRVILTRTEVRGFGIS